MNSDKLKSIISKKANGDSDTSQRFYQLFYFERILERISISKYKNHIILKGGLLLTLIIGSDERTTKDMDATLKGISLNKEEVKNIFHEILNINIDDGVSFEIISIKDIALENKYGGFRLNILSKLNKNKTYVTVELTTGDIITPKEIKYNYKSIFENKKIPILSYTLETILAEKFHAIITKGILNTRLKDFYDIYILINTKMNEINHIWLISAIKNTFRSRKTPFDINYFKKIANYLIKDTNIQTLWKNYILKNRYAQDITFEDTVKALNKIINILESETFVKN